ncbi:MAG: 3'(2'),5'-bisphosphate nucleotidase CysQ [Magnetococcus sp. WYHC-3]
MPPIASLMPLMVAAVREAGTAVMRYFTPGVALDARDRLADKGLNNPLTRADLEADRILHQRLMGATPDYGWLSEESADDAVRLGRRRLWVVDPIDGTREFILGVPQFAVSVGLVEDGAAVAGCVYNPARGEMFTAVQGGGAYLDGAPIQVSGRRVLQGAACLSSHSETRRGEWEPFRHLFALTPMGSIAYKLALVAQGHVDLTFTLTPKSEWDICAAAVLVREAGGVVLDKFGHPLRFNQAVPKTSSVVACNVPLQQALLALLEPYPLMPDRHRTPTPAGDAA